MAVFQSKGREGEGEGKHAIMALRVIPAAAAILIALIASTPVFAPNLALASTALCDCVILYYIWYNYICICSFRERSLTVAEVLGPMKSGCSPVAPPVSL